MKTYVWVLATALPGEHEPLLFVFGSEKAAHDALDKQVRELWDSNPPEDGDSGAPLTYPVNDPWEAQDLLGSGWRGYWDITRHEVEVTEA